MGPIAKAVSKYSDNWRMGIQGPLGKSIRWDKHDANARLAVRDYVTMSDFGRVPKAPAGPDMRVYKGAWYEEIN